MDKELDRDEVCFDFEQSARMSSASGFPFGADDTMSQNQVVLLWDMLKVGRIFKLIKLSIKSTKTLTKYFLFYVIVKIQKCRRARSSQDYRKKFDSALRGKL
jgi:hypothetical protein